MSKDILIGVDAGTSVIKSVAFDLEGRQIAVAAVPNRYATGENGAATQDPDQTWRNCVLSLHALAQEVPNLGSRVAALAVTGQGDGTWLVGRDDRPVGDAWLWLDSRAGGVADKLRQREVDAARFAATGTGLTGCQQGPQLAYMKTHHPDRLDQAEVALHCKDWLYLKLTGVRTTDISEGCLTFGDFAKRGYSDAVIGCFELGKHSSLIPPLCDGAKEHHPLTSAAADETGLLAGTPVMLGYMDVVCSALGAGAYDPKSPAGCTILGTTAVHIRSSRAQDVVLDDALRSGYVIVTPIEGVVVQLQTSMAGTLNFDWVLGLASEIAEAAGAPLAKPDLLDLLSSAIAQTHPGTCLYHPYISEAGERGPFIDHTARASFLGLSTKHRFADLMRATAEGLALSARDCYMAMGGAPAEVRLTGGAAKSAALRTILSASLGTSVRQSHREESGAAGAAMIAAVSVGIYPDMTRCIETWVTPTLGQPERADAELAAIYDKLFPSFLAAQKALQPVWHRLANPTEAY